MEGVSAKLVTKLSTEEQMEHRIGVCWEQKFRVSNMTQVVENKLLRVMGTMGH